METIGVFLKSETYVISVELELVAEVLGSFHRHSASDSNSRQGVCCISQ